MVFVSAQPYDYELPTDPALALLIIDMQRDFLYQVGLNGHSIMEGASL